MPSYYTHIYRYIHTAEIKVPIQICFLQVSVEFCKFYQFDHLFGSQRR